MAKKTKITREELFKIELAVIRRSKVKQGFFDGRFATRQERNKKKYSRTQKHKGNGPEAF